MSERRPGVTYERTDPACFERRGLRRFASVGSLGALSVGAVISGDFFGWNFGLRAGGFGDPLVATGWRAALPMIAMSLSEAWRSAPPAMSSFKRAILRA